MKFVADLRVEEWTDNIPEVHVHAFSEPGAFVSTRSRGEIVAHGGEKKGHRCWRQSSKARAVGRVLELVGRQVQSPGRMALLHRSHDPIRVQGGLPVLVRRVQATTSPAAFVKVVVIV